MAEFKRHKETSVTFPPTLISGRRSGTKRPADIMEQIIKTKAENILIFHLSLYIRSKGEDLGENDDFVSLI